MRKLRRALTPDEHRCTGAELKRRRDWLGGLILSYAERYGKTHRTTRKAIAAEKAIDSLRCALDGQFAKDWPDEFDTRAYYPGPALAGSDVTD